jgi:hypothetical protein
MPRVAGPHLHLALLALAAPLALGACDWPPKSVSGTDGGSSGVPSGTLPSAAVIDEIDLSASAQASGRYYNIYGSISFHDDQEPVHLIRLRVPVIAKTYDYAAGDVQQALGLSLDLVVSSDVPLGGAGPTNFQITVVDRDGRESSPPVTKSVDLQ